MWYRDVYNYGKCIVNMIFKTQCLQQVLSHEKHVFFEILLLHNIQIVVVLIQATTTCI